MKKFYIYLCLAGILFFLGYQGRCCFAQGAPPGDVAAPSVDKAQPGGQGDMISGDILQRLKELDNTLQNYEKQKKNVRMAAQDILTGGNEAPGAAAMAEEPLPGPPVVKTRKVARARRRPAKRDETDLMKGIHIDDAFQEIKNLPPPRPFKRKESDIKVRDVLSPQEILEILISPEARQKKIDLDFDEAKLSDIIMSLGQAGSFNIVLDPKLKENVIDFHLKNATLQEALILLSNAFDLGFARVGESLFVTSREKIRSENMTSSIVKLKNLKVEEAEQLVKGLIENVNISQETNSLVLVGTPDEIIKVEKLLANMDMPQPQVILEAKIIEINKDALKDLGIDWSDAIKVSSQEGTRLAEPDNTLDPSRDLFEVYKFDRTPIMFDTIVKMLENQNKAKVLSNPRITTLNNKEAEIFVGDRIPYAVTTVASGVATTEVRYEEPGIRLRITPSIIEEGFVEIKIQPEVSFIFSFRGPDEQYPWVKKREATAYVRVKNNQAFIIGGLLNQEDKKNLYKVPLLGDIPWVGNLFKYETKTAVNNELIISVTPRIVGGDEDENNNPAKKEEMTASAVHP